MLTRGCDTGAADAEWNTIIREIDCEVQEQTDTTTTTTTAVVRKLE